MQTPQLVGFWKSTKYCTPTNPVAWTDPRLLPRSNYERQKTKIVDFLRRGERGEAYCGYSYCRFDDCPAPVQSMGSADFTDGVWVWPEGLAHYVEVHDIALPPEFMDHVLRARSVNASAIWLRWSAEHSQPISDDAPTGIEAVRALANELATPSFQLEFDVEDGWWVVRDGEVVVDMMRPRSFEAVEVYLHARRRVPLSEVLDIPTAKRLLSGGTMTGWLRNTLRRRRIENHSGQPILFGGTAGIGIPTDAVGLRYLLRVAEEDGEPFQSAVRARFARLWQ